MIRIAIVEDDKNFQEQLKEYLKRYEKENENEFYIEIFEDGVDIIEDYYPTWDIIFMDICMKHLDGIKSAQKIREYDKSVIIIFITTMARFAIKGYEVDALDFILKPINYIQISTKINKALNHIERYKKQKYLLLPINDCKERVSINEILFIEVKNHNLYFITANKSYTMRYSMREIEKELGDYSFKKCSQSYLVNLKYVTMVKNNTVIVGEYELSISRPRKKQFLKELSDYIGNGYL